MGLMEDKSSTSILGPSRWIREFSADTHWKCRLSAAAARHLRRDDGFHLPGKQVRRRDFIRRLAEYPTHLGLAGEKLAATRCGNMGSPRWRESIFTLSSDVLGSLRPCFVTGAKTLPIGPSP